MKIKLDKSSFNQGLEKLKSEYKILAPKTTPFKGTFSDTDITKYEEIRTIEEIEFNKKSNFSAKETILPITQVLFYFTEKEYKTSDIDDKKLLVFLRACDLNGVKRIDEIYLRNGIERDYYYERLREKVKFVLIGCKESFRNCFCVSMDSNKSDNYSMAINLRDDEIYLDIKDSFLDIFEGEACDFEVDYVKENIINLEVPENINPVELSKHPMWDEYDARCINVTLSVQHVHALLCKIYITKKMKTLEKEEEYGHHVKLMDIQIWLEDIPSEKNKGKE